MGVSSIDAIIPFPLGLGLSNEHSLNSYHFPYRICYI